MKESHLRSVVTAKISPAHTSPRPPAPRCHPMARWPPTWPTAPRRAKIGITSISARASSTSAASTSAVIGTDNDLYGLQKELGVQSEEEARRLATRKNAMGRFGKPEELANAIVFLCSERSSYITGISLNTDGGRLKGLW